MLDDRLKDILVSLLGLERDDLSVEIPENQNFGDYTTNIAMRAFGDKNLFSRLPKEIEKGKSPQDLALSIASFLEKSKDLMQFVGKIEVKRPGFINFWLKEDTLIYNLRYLDTYKNKNIGRGKTVVIDYSSPNIAKNFSIGHLRSTIIGQALYNLYSFLGYRVIGDNHLGDWGSQFGALICEIINSNVSLDSLTVEKLEEMYVEFNRKAKEDPKLQDQARFWFKKLEDGDPKARKIWQTCRKISLEEFERIYKLLGVSFDFVLGESYYEDEMKALLKDKKLIENLEEGEAGAKIIRLDEFGIKTPLMVLKSDGATTYATRDLACLRFRMRRFSADIVIYEVGQEQTLHFKQVFAASRKLGIVPEDVILYHTQHGLYLDQSGHKFSTRKGGVVNLEDVLKEAIKKAKEIITNSATSRNLSSDKIEEVSEKVGIGAIKYFDLKHSVKSDIVFDWNKILSLEGNSGPYLQYTFARTFSVLKKAGSFKFDFKSAFEVNEDEKSLLRFIFHFEEVIKKAAFEFSPNLLCDFLFELCQKFNSFYDKYPILKEEDLKKRQLRLKLTEAVSLVLKKGLGILGIEAVEKM
ncbi:MAG: arginine--tRNA ligase [Patescibacteria group bacterium]|nr:MAG: arginine--tRNA ligase [Patescibacteria group bacterium]